MRKQGKCMLCRCKYVGRFMAVVMILVLLFNIQGIHVHAASSGSDVEGFVTRLYNICLDRAPDQSGFNNWVNQLKNGKISGAEAAYGFIFSDEFAQKNPCNDDYVTSLYRCFLGREPDATGKQNWLNTLSEGSTRGAVFNGFVGSTEFSQIFLTLYSARNSRKKSMQ